MPGKASTRETAQMKIYTDRVKHIGCGELLNMHHKYMKTWINPDNISRVNRMLSRPSMSFEVGFRAVT